MARYFGKIIVNCRTRQENNSFLYLMKQEGYNIEGLAEAWEIYKEETCFNIRQQTCVNFGGPMWSSKFKTDYIHYGSKSFYKNKNNYYYIDHEFLTYTEFIEKFYTNTEQQEQKHQQEITAEKLTQFLEAIDVTLSLWQKDLLTQYLNLNKDKT